MSSTSGRNSPSHICNPDDFKFVILDRPKQPGFIIEARSRNSDCQPQRATDLQFNLSSLLGNNDGEFAWGRTSFEKTGTDFKLCEKTGELTGKLLNLDGVYKPVSISLRKRLYVESYIDRRTAIRYHKIKETQPLASRTLILCFDGTSNQFSTENTNVVKLVELLRKDDPDRQMVYYQTGVGTYAPPGVSTSIGLKVASVIDEGVAWYLYQHVIDGYKFLMQTYRAGDRIALFGFSRGAFTARALAGMLHSVGLLPAHNTEHVPFAYEVYKNAEDKTNKPKKKKSMFTFPWSEPVEGVEPEEFKRTFCVPVIIDFVGVWDTVASVGAIFAQELPFIAHNPSILVFRQALALDERRGSFIPSLWNHSLTDQATQDVREVWFRGEHSDIGGGSRDHDDVHDGRLSNISLRWMIRQIIESKSGLLFDHVTVRSYWEKDIIEEMRPRNEDEDERAWVDRVKESIKLDVRDVHNELFDSIRGKRRLLWDFIEYFGINSKLTNNAEFETGWTRWPNRRTPRSIYCKDPNYPIYIHSSVVDYMLREHKEGSDDHIPRAIWHYNVGEYPRIEEVLPPSTGGAQSPVDLSFAPPSRLLPPNARIPIHMVPLTESPEKGWWSFRPSTSRLFSGCAVAVTAWLLLQGTLPKSESMVLNSYLETISW